MCCFARAAAMSGRPRCARYGLGRRSLMSKGPCPLTARCGIGRLCGERRRRERCERLKGARNAPRRTPRLSSPGHAPQHRPAKAPAVCVRFRRGRRVPAPTARAMGAGLPAPAARERFECPKARREACALWALGPKAQSDPKRGSETMSATVREARMIEQPGHKKRGKRQTAAHTAGPLARTSPQRFGEPQLYKLKSESSDIRGGFGSLAQARLPYAGRRPAKPAAKPPAK